MPQNSTRCDTSPTLGVVAISYNEEQNLPVFIEHLLPWVNEIVIIDDGSSDRTAEIAMKGGSKVNFLASPRNEGEYFSDQRNKGIAASTSHWLLHMDIDERVTPALADEIKTVIQNSEKDAYRFRRLNFFLHRPMRGGGLQGWNLIHLSRRDILKFGGMYHEECIVQASSERIGQLNAQMWHLNEDSYEKRMSKSLLYCTELSSKISKKTCKIHWYSFFIRPFIEFVKQFIFKHGYRDGIPGLIWALHAADATFRSYALAWDQQYHISRQEIESIFSESWKEYNENMRKIKND
ncbi:MAG: glycosyltransferase family 2 protein [Candidatus Electrothrix aestuarii]|uniref:Glycosyltransferase family 2 protein n=1 Tax=Candidatus Electrothrix aestuarii TaxID=3062594 RepID=A0AAU8LYA9_9BACT|nr:glycosyltransferase family 2 protein [Candidatus Electrothrix aestuarii]